MLICSNLLQVVDCCKWCSDACICDIFCCQLNCGLSYVLTGLGTCWCFKEKGDRCWKGTRSALCQGWILYVPKFYTLLSPAWCFSIILPEYALPAIWWNLTWFKHKAIQVGFDSEKKNLNVLHLKYLPKSFELAKFWYPTYLLHSRWLVIKDSAPDYLMHSDLYHFVSWSIAYALNLKKWHCSLDFQLPS